MAKLREKLEAGRSIHDITLRQWAVKVSSFFLIINIFKRDLLKHGFTGRLIGLFI